ncbi:MAG: nicotinamide riboside transporter PnuC [Bacteroidota bacterium]
MDLASFWDSFLLAAESEGFFYWSELLAVMTGIVYVVLATRSNPWCWPWGIVSSALWAYAAYVLFDLYVDALLQLFYVGMGIVGWQQWRRGAEGEVRPVSRLRSSEHLAIVGVGLALALPIGYFFAEYTPAAATYIDAWTTVFSVLATILVVKRKLENWLYWIAIDAVYVYLYYTRGGYLFALLFVAYTIIAIIGYRAWWREWKANGQKGRSARSLDHVV